MLFPVVFEQTKNFHATAWVRVGHTFEDDSRVHTRTIIIKIERINIVRLTFRAFSPDEKMIKSGAERSLAAIRVPFVFCIFLMSTFSML